MHKQTVLVGNQTNYEKATTAESFLAREFLHQPSQPSANEYHAPLLPIGSVLSRNSEPYPDYLTKSQASITQSTPIPSTSDSRQSLRIDPKGHSIQTRVTSRHELFDELSDVLIEHRSYQDRIIRKTLSYLGGSVTRSRKIGRSRRPSVLIESPNGSGKTIMGLAIGRVLQQQFGCRIGWIARHPEERRRVEDENRKRRINVDLELLDEMDGESHRFDCLFIDQAQHDFTTSLGGLFDVSSQINLVGLTSSPFRLDRIRRCFSHIIKGESIHQLIGKGFLSPYLHYLLPVWTPNILAATYGADRCRWGKSLIFFDRHDESRQCCDALARHGVRAEVVSGTHDRRRQFDDFQSARLDVLITSNALLPEAEFDGLKTVFCRPDSKAFTLQMSGRVFRKCSAAPYKQVVQSIDSRFLMSNSVTPLRQFFLNGDRWATGNELDESVRSRFIPMTTLDQKTVLHRAPSSNSRL